MRGVALAALALVVGASGCGGSSTSREDALRALKAEAVVPGFERAQAAAVELEQAVADTCSANPSSSPAETAAALARARAAWIRTQAFWAGPVMDRRSWSWIDGPADPERIAALLAADEPKVVDADYVRTRIGAGQRGYGAIEIVLGDDTVGPPSRRCAYLRAMATVAAAELDEIVTAWTAGEAESLPEGFTVDELVGDAIGMLEMIEKDLARAIKEKDFEDDLFAGDEATVDHGADDLRARLSGVRQVLVGSGDDASGPTGLAPLLGDEIVADLEQRLDALDEASAGLSGSLASAVDEDPAAVADTLKRATELKRTVATQVVSHLGITVGFSDADGDSG